MKIKILTILCLLLVMPLSAEASAWLGDFDVTGDLTVAGGSTLPGIADDYSFSKITADTTITECDGQMYWFTGSWTATLDPVATLGTSANCCFSNIGSNTVSVMMHENDLLYLNGTAGSDGAGATTPTIGEGLCLGYFDATGMAIPGLTNWTVEDAPGYDTTGITFWWSAEAADFSAANGTTEYSAGDATATLESAATISADAKKMGTYGLDIPTSGDWAEFTPTSIINSPEGRVGFWINVNTHALGRTIFRLTYGADDRFFLAMAGTSEIKWDWKDGATARTVETTSGAGLGSGSGMKWFEFAWKASSYYRQVWINNTSVLNTSSTIGTFSNSPIKMQLGEVLLGDTCDYHMDHFIMTMDSTKSLYEARDQVNYND